MFLKQRHSKISQRGLTFVEVLVALVINLIMLSALLSVVSSNLNHYALLIQMNDLSQQLESALNIMVNDIRRAGYWSSASSDVNTGQNNNPFMSGSNDITVTNGSCIQFTYDQQGTGSLPAISSTSDDDRYGYRLTNATLQTRPAGSNQSCVSSASSWENVTDPKTVNVTNLNFNLSSTTVPIGATSNYMMVRSVSISITGQLVSNSSVTKTYTTLVKIRNDKYSP